VRARAVNWLLIAVAATAPGCAAYDQYYMETSTARAARPVEEAAFQKAVALVAELHYEEAAEELLPLAAAFEEAGDRSRAAEALFWVAFCREKQGRTDEATAGYDRVVRRYLQTVAARQAAARLSRLRGDSSH